MFAGLLLGGPAFFVGGLGGAAAGALYGRLVDRGLDDGWVKDMAEWVPPGTSALLLLVDAGFDHQVVTELHRFEGIGRVAFTTLPPDAKAEIERALSGPDRRWPVRPREAAAGIEPRTGLCRPLPKPLGHAAVDARP